MAHTQAETFMQEGWIYVNNLDTPNLDTGLRRLTPRCHVPFVGKRQIIPTSRWGWRRDTRPPLAPQTAWFTAKTVAAFLTTTGQHLKPNSKKRRIGVIRGYVRHLALQGIPVDSGFLQLPLAAPVWKLDAVPRMLSVEDLERLLQAYDGTTPGRCDYACFIDLGLRVSEVAGLTLDDWD